MVKRQQIVLRQDCVLVKTAELEFLEAEVRNLKLLNEHLAIKGTSPNAPMWRFLCCALVHEGEGGHWHRSALRMLMQSYDTEHTSIEEALVDDFGIVPQKICELCRGSLQPMIWCKHQLW